MTMFITNYTSCNNIYVQSRETSAAHDKGLQQLENNIKGEYLATSINDPILFGVVDIIKVKTYI